MTKKPWTILLYIVAKVPPDLDDADYMNAKANEVIDKVVSAAADRRMYVAYQIVGNPVDGIPAVPFARILNPDPTDAAPPHHQGWFRTPTPDSHDTLLMDDLKGFYKFVLTRCPAEHYAVFFWGHSFGPAGLFEVEAPVTLPDLDKETPSMNLVQLGTACAEGQLFMSQMDPGGVVGPNGQVAPTRKFDVIFFQSCWMSTLETAFQLKDKAKLILASQSLVPFGRPTVKNKCGVSYENVPHGAGVWPYASLFDDLLAYDASKPPHFSLEQLIVTLGNFYDANQAHEIWPNPSLPFTLLDLEKIDGIHDAFGKIKTALDQFDRPTRGAIIEQASIAVGKRRLCVAPQNQQAYTSELAAGSIALVDLERLCRRLSRENLDDDEQDAVNQVLNSGVVVQLHETVDQAFLVTDLDNGALLGTLTGAGLGFRGISVFYYPTEKRLSVWKDTDEGIYPDASSNFYCQRLEFATATRWGDIAFEQL